MEQEVDRSLNAVSVDTKLNAIAVLPSMLTNGEFNADVKTIVETKLLKYINSL